MRNFIVLLLNEIEEIERFSNLHWCNFKDIIKKLEQNNFPHELDQK